MFFGRKKQAEVLAALERDSKQPRYWRMVWKRFRKNRTALWAWRGVATLFVIALLGTFIANEKPLYAKIGDTHYFPVFRNIAVQLNWSKWDKDLIHADWVTMDYESVIRAPIPYGPNYIDKKNTGKGPFSDQNIASTQFRHWLGTDDLGRDVAAGMIQGTRISLMVGIITMTIACMIGLILGTVAGYFGDGRLELSRVRLVLNVIGLSLGLYYALGVRSYQLTEGNFILLEWIKRFFIFVTVLLGMNSLSSLLEKISFLGKRVVVGIDLIIMRIIESLNTIPGLFLLLAILPLFSGNSIFNIMLILGLISWTGIAQFARGEMLRVRNLQYVEAAQALGYSSRRIILRHALPNALTPILIVIAFGMAGAILAESSLSFLGIGSGEITWGTILSKGRNYLSYWWLTVLPGLAIFFTVTCFNLIGDGLSEALRNSK
ncbi:MAG: ABC transporter permease [Saprospiraceae bacterium]